MKTYTSCGSAVVMRTRLDAVGIGSHPLSARRHHAAPSHGMTYSRSRQRCEPARSARPGVFHWPAVPSRPRRLVAVRVEVVAHQAFSVDGQRGVRRGGQSVPSGHRLKVGDGVADGDGDQCWDAVGLSVEGGVVEGIGAGEAGVGSLSVNASPESVVNGPLLGYTSPRTSWRAGGRSASMAACAPVCLRMASPARCWIQRVQESGQSPFKDSNLRAPSHPRYGMVPNHDGIVAHITSGTTPAESDPTVNGVCGPTPRCTASLIIPTRS